MKTPEEMVPKAFTINDIRSWNPCYDPSKYLPEGWAGTAIDILKHESIPSQDKLWVVCREEVLNARTLRVFAVLCARQFEHLMTDERSKNAINVAERFANGNATQAELDAAMDAAWEAAGNAARAAACDAAWYAAWAARHAACDAAGAAAWEAAWEAARAAQVAKLLKMVEGK